MHSTIETLKRWALIESPSHEPECVNRMMDAALEIVAPSVKVERIPGRGGHGDHLVLRSPGAHPARSGTLLIGHLDTVHPLGTVAGSLAVRQEGDRLYGPGLYDMKSGILIGIRALNAVAESAERERAVTMVITSDEEVGSPTSRDLIESLARSATSALVFESGRPGGAVVTSRKGVGWFHIEAEGRPAHAGTHHHEGRSAILEAARQIVDLEKLTSDDGATTVSVGIVKGGSALNVVPQRCTFGVDFRVPSEAEAKRITQAVSSLRPYDPDVRLKVSGGLNRPPFVRSAETGRLFERLREQAGVLGQDIAEVPMTGGGSDANFVAALGIPTIDGLGALGAGAHTIDEYCLISSIEPRQNLVDALIGALNNICSA